MAEVILMPRLSDTMTEGVIAAWHKKVGDSVKKGDLLAEVETDKATMELESYKDGVLLHIGTDKGGKLQVNDLLAIIGTAGEDISGLMGAGTAAPAAAVAPAATPEAPAAPAPAVATAPSSLDISKMDEVVLMPRLSDTMEAGVIASWNKKVGDTVKKGEVLAEIETDKATMELESYKNGTLLYVGAAKGEKILVNGLLCVIGEKGKVDVDAIIAASKGGSVSAPVSTPAPTSTPATAVVSAPAAVISAPVTAAAPVVQNGRVKASPLAKKIAQEKGVDLRLLQGSGDGGRIIKADIDNYKPGAVPAAAATAPAATVAAFAGSTEEGYTDLPNSQMRNVIARRLGESKFSAPHFYLTMEINMDNAMAARTQLNEISPAKISFNDMVVKAVALALRQHPAINASWMGDKIRRYKHIHIGIAVAIEDGLIVPVVRFADQKTLPQIAAESKELAGKAKTKKLQPNEFTGNTFTISNLGMMDIEEFTAIINPPDSAIMAVGRIKETVVRKGEGFGVSNFMKVTLSCDHRSVDGASGAAFLQTFKKYLENPITMLL
ncbi:MAG TPA: pyruvate dehydrogenase complex dihydrolipoamide acetyltransferase [Chitinophagaceae bacterium]|nr:pyruvate dehydrogenase complex dihydrolipoamide acetyltransferase [Chitinophagaceae bacterium]